MNHSLINTHEDILEISMNSSIKKANRPIKQTFMLGFLGGIWISLGAIASIVMYTTVSDAGIGKFLGGIVFSVALLFVVLAGGEFFTGNNLITLGAISKKHSYTSVAINWFYVFLGNFFGAIMMVYIMYYTGIFGYDTNLNDFSKIAINIANNKVKLSFVEALTRGILCNLLVAGAVWLQSSSKDVAGKFWTIVFPITAFIVSGFEHVVANMFYIPIGLLLGADFSVVDMLYKNFLPVAIGNIISGGIMIPVFFYITYVKLAPKK